MTEILDELQNLRHTLHSRPDLSHKESDTAGLILKYLEPYSPDDIITGLGGHGVAAVYNGKSDGPTVLVRAELDALPIPESIKPTYRSQREGVAHKCGHDGHMTMVSSLASTLHEARPERGRVVLLYQPAEETGEGAQLVIDDPEYSKIRSDYVFALHNLPGYPKGQIIVRDGTFASASKGLVIRLQGATSHAAEPERGNSPTLAVAELINGLSAAPQFFTALHQNVKVTVIHVQLGEIAFGTSPGYAEVMATLRSHRQRVMNDISARCEQFARATAERYGLEVETEWVEEFPATVNDVECAGLIREIAGDLELDIHEAEEPFAWSEDFGNFTAVAKGALFGLGSGEDTPALHNPTYDFPDDLIPYGSAMFGEILHRLVGTPEPTTMRDAIRGR
jgi:amidohydrolase